MRSHWSKSMQIFDRVMKKGEKVQGEINSHRDSKLNYKRRCQQ